MTAIDAYCLYNRARGTDLISPEDFYIASTEFTKISVGINFRMLKSKVWVFESGNYFFIG